MATSRTDEKPDTGWSDFVSHIVWIGRFRTIIEDDDGNGVTGWGDTAEISQADAAEKWRDLLGDDAEDVEEED